MKDRIFMSSHRCWPAGREMRWLPLCGPAGSPRWARRSTPSRPVAGSPTIGVEHCGGPESSGTAALHLGLLTLGVGPGDLVLTSTMTFAATANAITYTGAEPVFVDCEWRGPETWMPPCSRRRSCSRGRGSHDHRGGGAGRPARQGRRPRGGSDEVAAAHGVPVLADAAESLGATRDERSRPPGRAAAVSFNGNKVMTTSGGGAGCSPTTRTGRAGALPRHPGPSAPVHYEHTDIGFNYLTLQSPEPRSCRALSCLRLRRDGGAASPGHRVTYSGLSRGVPGVTVFAVGGRRWRHGGTTSG